MGASTTTRPSGGLGRKVRAPIAIAVAAAWLAVAGCRPTADEPLGEDPLTVLPGLHHLGGLGPAASYAIETTEGLVLIDAGLEADALALRAQIAALGLDPARLKAILLTHAHADHSGGAATLRAATGARIYAGRGDAAVLRAGTPRAAFFGPGDPLDHDPHPTPVDVELDGGERLAFGNVRLDVVAAPGHTPGSLCYWFDHRGLGILFGGDVVGHLGDRGGLGTAPAYRAPRYRGDARAFLATLDRLRALPTPDLVLPGHPRQDPPRGPKVDPGRWSSMIEEGVVELRRLVDRYEADGADFLDGEPKILLPGLLYLGDRGGRAIYGLRDGDRLLVVGASGGPGLARFLRDRQRQLGLDPVGPSAVLLTIGDAEETAGLADLAGPCAGRPTVFAHPSAVASTIDLAPPDLEVLPATELADHGWPDLQPIALKGPEPSPMAYLLRRQGRTILISGRVPAPLDPIATARLADDLGRSRDDAADFLVSVARLRHLEPDLWLPAMPADASNANLYDDAWSELVSRSFRLGNRVLSRLHGTPGGP